MCTRICYIDSWQVRKTLSDCFGKEAMSYIGALSDGPESLELIQFHSGLVMSQLASISELDSYHQAFPWKIVATIDAGSVAGVLSEMKKAWEFTTAFLDGLPKTDKLFTLMQFTRYQAYRDAMVKAEHLSIQSVDKMIFPLAFDAFMAIVNVEKTFHLSSTDPS